MRYENRGTIGHGGERQGVFSKKGGKVSIRVFWYRQ